MRAIRHAVHGSIVAVIWVAFAWALLCYASTSSHGSQIACGMPVRFTHHHVRSTFATLNESGPEALRSLPFPSIMHCWRYGSALARAGGTPTLLLDATTKDGTRKPSVCGSATLLATVLAIANTVVRHCFTLCEHVIQFSTMFG